MWAITRASLTAVLRSPSAVVFSLAFPLIFIIVFGFIGGGSRVSLSIAIDKNSDTANPVYTTLKNFSGLKIVNKTEQELKVDLEKGRLTAIIKIDKTSGTAAPYTINLKSSESVNPQNLQVLKSMLNAIISGINKEQYPQSPTFALINENMMRCK